MNELPARTEAAPYYFRYIDRVTTRDIVEHLQTQLDETLDFYGAISEEDSLQRYAPDKWSIRQVVNHVNDCERLFLFRAFWFARGFDSPLPSYDQDVCAAAAHADEFSWSSHVADFVGVRSATVSFYRNLPKEAWTRSGIASDNPFSVRALAYITAGHVDHHRQVLREKYLVTSR